MKLSKRANLSQSQPMFDIMSAALNIEKREKKKIIHLEIGNTSFFNNSKLIKILKSKISHKFINYVPSEGNTKLRKKLSNIFSEKLNQKLNQENIIISSANSLVTKFLHSVTDKGDRILLPSPCFSTYNLSAEFLELKVFYYELNENKNWQPSINLLTDIIKKNSVKVLVLNSPSNPLGKKIDNLTIKKIFKLCSLNKIYLLIDNTYAFMDFDFKKINLPKDNNVFYIYSFSKDSAAPGLRAGFGIGNELIINKIGNFNSMIESCYPGFIQEAIYDYLDYKDSFSKKVQKEIISRIKTIDKIFNKTKFLKIIIPDGGIFMFIKVLLPNFDGTSFALGLLENKFVCVCPGKYFGENHHNYFRINLALSHNELITASKKIVDYANYLAVK